MTQDIDSKSDLKNTNSKRKILFFGLLFVIVCAFLAYGSYYYIIGSKYVSTDNAYVSAEIAQVASSIGGTIKEIHYKDTDKVKAGDMLVVIDDTDFQLLLENAEANLAKAQVDFERAQIDRDRRIALAKSGSVSHEEVTNATNAFKAAQVALKAALVKIQQAKVELARTTVFSPINGVIAKRQVQLGQRVQAGMCLLSVVPLDHVYVNANFKESQLRKVKIGQPVELRSDLYGRDVVFHGKVVGIAGGTGSAFAMIPAQNATGNWIKVIQRLPIRIELDPKELKQYPLQVGLSMEASINIASEK